MAATRALLLLALAVGVVSESYLGDEASMVQKPVQAHHWPPIVGAAYAGTAVSGGHSKTAFWLSVGPTCGSTHHFFASNHRNRAHLVGQLTNFVGTTEFSADVSFQNLPWTGKLSGNNWTGVITMSNGWTYNVNVRPQQELALSSSGLKQTSGALTQTSSSVPEDLPAYSGACDAEVGGQSFSFEISQLHKHGHSRYNWVAAGFSCASTNVQAYSGLLSHIRSDKDTDEFDSHIEFEWPIGWKGKLSSKNWKGKIMMDNGYSYDCSWAPF